jgi:hypothetical protein
MAKRFIDTAIFDDSWYMDLSKDGKILWLYFITKCDHAGMLTLNIKLCKVQTGINDIPTVIKELGNRLITVSQLLFFIPKFIEFQYPNFPNSNVKQQASAIEILSKYQLFNKETLTVTKQLPNSYDNDNDNDNDNDIVNVNVNENEEQQKKLNFSFEDFWNLYDKKVGDKDKINKKWQALTDQEREAAIKYIPGYVASRPDKQFRKDPATFLNNKSWNDEIIQPTTKRNANPLLSEKKRDYSKPQTFK